MSCGLFVYVPTGGWGARDGSAERLTGLSQTSVLVNYCLVIGGIIRVVGSGT